LPCMTRRARGNPGWTASAAGARGGTHREVKQTPRRSRCPVGCRNSGHVYRISRAHDRLPVEYPALGLDARPSACWQSWLVRSRVTIGSGSTGNCTWRREDAEPFEL
jgi:hypothetical protein